MGGADTYDKVSVQLLTITRCHADNTLGRNVIDEVVVYDLDATRLEAFVKRTAEFIRVSLVERHGVTLHDRDFFGLCNRILKMAM
jgi:hypothetical protein